MHSTNSNVYESGLVEKTIESDTERIPQSKTARDALWRSVRGHVAVHRLVPPLTLDELSDHADRILTETGAPQSHRDYITVLVGNALWADTMASVPYNRRVLLLPQCMRSKALCPAGMDEFGLLCEECGQCATGALQAEAEKLGYVVLVAEGTTVVTKLLEKGTVDAVIGVSCLSALERSFPYMAAAAIPGLAIPLHKDGCDQTQVDLDWLNDAIRLKSDASWTRLDLDVLRSEISQWFQHDCLIPLLDTSGTRTEKIAAEWMATGGKRWRPVLSVCTYKALTGMESLPELIKTLAVAVECFHKASLAHDDIEDNDNARYGLPSLHRKHGVPVALNAGDLLVGQGYRLIGECGATPVSMARMLGAASHGHRDLCLGQGEELAWTRQPEAISVEEVLNIFRLKTAPAFEVALTLGALAADANGEVCAILKAFSNALGTAYQIRDDLEDFVADNPDNDLRSMRPSLLLALALERSDEETRMEIARLLEVRARNGLDLLVRETVQKGNLEEEARNMVEHYKTEAIRALQPLQNVQLKSLLARLVYKILGNGSKVKPKNDKPSVHE